MARAGKAASAGWSYFEASIVSEGDDHHARFGWATRKATDEGNVGYDAYSYGYRDVNGFAFHKQVGADFGGEPWGPKDVIGCGILQNSETRRAAIYFFKNGVSQGCAFPDVPYAAYLPAVSVFGGAVVEANFGPDFHYAVDAPVPVAMSPRLSEMAPRKQDRDVSEPAGEQSQLKRIRLDLEPTADAGGHVSQLAGAEHPVRLRGLLDGGGGMLQQFPAVTFWT